MARFSTLTIRPGPAITPVSNRPRGLAPGARRTTPERSGLATQSLANLVAFLEIGVGPVIERLDALDPVGQRIKAVGETRRGVRQAAPLT